ncbi:MAG: nuclease-related domain-containing protein [Actinomycetes bacterium]
MAAGGSAHEQAARATQAAATLERKAAAARRRAGAFEAGAAGEESVRDATSLMGEGWFTLHDRSHPHGGNVDHLAIGPTGVFVLDAKHWAGPVTASPQEGLRQRGRSRTAQLESLAETTSHVRSALASQGCDHRVLGLVVLTAAGRDQPFVDLGADLGVVGVDALTSHLTRGARRSESVVERALEVLLGSFPGADQARDQRRHTHAQARDVRAMFEKSNDFVYLEPWSKAGRRRVYLNDASGRTLGHRDLVAGTVNVVATPSAAGLPTGSRRADQHPAADLAPDVVSRLLGHVDETGIHLRPDDVPRVAVRLPGGRLLAATTALSRQFVIGYRWRRGAADRLYVTWASRDWVHDVGFVDLRDVRLHPAQDAPFSSGASSPARILELALARYPRTR